MLKLDVDVEGGGKPVVTSLGPLVEGPVYEQSFSSDACEERDAADVIWALYPVVEPFDTELLLPLTSVAHGTGRVQNWLESVDSVLVSYVAGDNGAIVMFDADLDEPCTALRLTGGDWTCLPESAGRGEIYYYGDAGCQTPVVAAGNPSGTLFALTQRNFCVREGFGDDVVALHELGAAIAGSLYVGTGAADCTLSVDQAPAGHFELGPAVASAAPVLVELRE